MKDRLSRLGSAVARELREAQARRRYREAEEALRASEQRFRATFEQAAVGMAHVGLDGKWLRINRRLCDIVGYGEGEMLGMSFQEITHPVDLDANLARVDALIDGEIETYSMENRYLRKDGSVVLVKSTISMVVEPLGEPGYFVFVIEDITERKRAERELRLRDRAIAASSNAIAIADATHPDHPLTYVNPAFEAMSGYGAEEVLGRNCRFLQAGDRDQPGIGEMREAMGEGRYSQVVLRNYKKDGTPFYNEVSVSPVYGDEGRITAFVAVQNDITDRIRIEGELRQSEERYRAVVEQTAECLFLFDAETKRLLETNTAFQRLFGYTAGELEDMSIYDIVEDDPANVDANVRRNLERGHYDIGERRYRRKDGSLVDVEVSGNVISYGTRGEVVLGIARDITERKRAEERMREVREQERRRIARDLHDEVLSDLVYALQDVQIHQAFSSNEGKSLEGTAEALRRSVEGLRAAIFEMRLQESLEQSFSSSLWSLVELNRRMARGGTEVGLELGEGFPSVLPERQGRELVRVLQEAMNNARRHSGARRIKVALGREGDRFWAEVSDDGRGFDAAVLRGGVGVSSMRQRAARLGGKLEVHSVPGRGTKICFSAPVDQMLDRLNDAESRSEGFRCN